MAGRRRGDHNQLNPGPIGIEDGRARLAIRVTPKANRDSSAGIVTQADGRKLLAIRLAAPPVDGAANKALVAFLSRQLKIPKSRIRIVSGETARLKIVEVETPGDVDWSRLTGE
jgi:uncharacterized protein (TIGR00251 family)